jgi:hypothetical protein
MSGTPAWYQDISISFSILLSLAIALKTAAFITTPFWVYRHGAEYLSNLHAQDSMADQRTDYWNLLDKSNGKIFPFGLRGYRLLRFREEGRNGSWLRRVLGFLATASQKLFNLAGIATISVCILLISGIAWVLPTEARWMGLIICFEMLAWPLLITIESILAYSAMGSYGGAYYRPQNFYSKKGKGQLLIELARYAFSLSFTFICDMSIMVFLAVNWHAFYRLNDLIGRGQQLDRIGNAIYYTLTNFFAAGDAGPASPVGKLVVSIIIIHGVIYFALILAVLISIPSIENLDSAAEEPANPSDIKPVKAEREDGASALPAAMMGAGVATLVYILVSGILRKGRRIQ